MTLCKAPSAAPPPARAGLEAARPSPQPAWRPQGDGDFAEVRR